MLRLYLEPVVAAGAIDVRGYVLPDEQVVFAMGLEIGLVVLAGGRGSSVTAQDVALRASS